MVFCDSSYLRRMASTRGLAPPEEQAAAIAVLSRLVAEHGTPADVGPMIGASGEAVRKAVKRGEIGPRVIRLVADFAKMTVAEMVAKHGPPSERAPSAAEAERYPSRRSALAGAAALGYSPAAIVMVAERTLKSDGDPGEAHWWNELDAAEATAKRQAGRLAAISLDAGEEFDVPPKTKAKARR